MQYRDWRRNWAEMHWRVAVATLSAVLVVLCVPPIASAERSVVRRQLFDPNQRIEAPDPARTSDVAEVSVSNVKCGTVPRDVDAATLAEAAARAAQNAATFRATGLRGYVEVADVQVDKDEGIRFLLEFINEGSDLIELSDVTNALNITLFRRTIPGGGHVIPPWSPYRTGPPVYTTEYPDEAEIRAEARAAKKELEKRRPYGVAEPMRRSPKIRTIRDIRDTEEVHLNPGERFQMVVRITQGLVDPAEYWWNQAELSKRLNGFSLQSPDPSDIGALIAGEYSLSLWVSVSVSTPDAEETATMRQHALLFCDSIPIRLGEEPENSAEK